jgi:exodeoxyribonuclease V gamma subunit
MVLCASRPDGVGLQTRHFAFDMDLRFDSIPADEAERHLADLLDLYREGLERPVPFFRKASWAYAEKENLSAARSCWAGGYGAKGAAENRDVWHSLAWRGAADPLEGEFAEIAKRVFGPIIRHGILSSRQE